MRERFLTRRVFARRLATGCIAGGPLASAANQVLSQPAPTAPSAKAAEPLANSTQGIDSKEVEPEDLILELVKREYPKNLQEEHLPHIRREIQQQLTRLKILSSFPLTNADEPAPILRAYRRE